MSNHSNPTERRAYRLGKDLIIVEVLNNHDHYSCRIIVNGQASDWADENNGALIVVHSGWTYIDFAQSRHMDHFPTGVPFLITQANQAEEI